MVCEAPLYFLPSISVLSSPLPPPCPQPCVRVKQRKSPGDEEAHTHFTVPVIRRRQSQAAACWPPLARCGGRGQVAHTVQFMVGAVRGLCRGLSSRVSASPFSRGVSSFSHPLHVVIYFLPLCLSSEISPASQEQARRGEARRGAGMSLRFNYRAAPPFIRNAGVKKCGFYYGSLMTGQDVVKIAASMRDL